MGGAGCVRKHPARSCVAEYNIVAVGRERGERMWAQRQQNHGTYAVNDDHTVPHRGEPRETLISVTVLHVQNGPGRVIDEARQRLLLHLTTTPVVCRPQAYRLTCRVCEEVHHLFLGRVALISGEVDAALDAAQLVWLS